MKTNCVTVAMAMYAVLEASLECSRVAYKEVFKGLLDYKKEVTKL